uniref:PRKR-interacting protein 1 n=1 Tax=Anopheles atroparvus TaxID=41427 RepID=A0AAG5DME0_ANOAO
MEIRNEVKPSEKEIEKKKFVVRNAADVQRAKLEKLMKNPDKPVVIPAPARNRDFSNAIPSFVRNVMGSSAGAGSGEFHVYRHLRRKEYARQKQIQEKSRSELLDDAFQDKLEQNRKAAEERTSKKRAKRLKKKAKQKAHGGKKPKLTTTEEEPSSSSPSESDDAPDEAQVDTAGEDAQNSCTDGKDSAEQGNVTNDTSKDDDEPKDENVGSTSKPVVSSKDNEEDQSNSKEEQSADTNKSEQDKDETRNGNESN